jgi:iron complex transport system substrate-binding protein
MPLRRLRRLAAAAASLALLSAGCGATGAVTGTGSGSGTDGPTRTVRTAMGPVDVPVSPKRIVVLDIGELDSLLTLGVTPVGAVRSDVSEGFPDYLPGDTSRTQVVGTIGSPDLEAIHALEPDLILSSRTRDGDHYDKLRQIAPTVLAERVGGVWRENFLLDADAVGRKAQAEKFLADLDARARRIGRSLPEPATVTASVVRFTGTEIRSYCASSFAGTVLHAVGLGRPAAEASEGSCPSANGTWAPLSPERLADADADYLFWSTYGPVDRSTEPRTTSSALWRNLRAVRGGTAVRVNDDYWFTGVGPSAAVRILDDLEEILGRAGR